MRALTGALVTMFLFAAAPTAPAQQSGPTTVSPDMIEAAKEIQIDCVKRGEDARVCSCGVGLAYAQLEPKVFKLVPQVAPLLDQKNKSSATAGLMSLAMGSGLSLSDLSNAYDTIHANRLIVRQICRPLVPAH